jgi:ABC-type oligopeptide transport system substrate-binding subunit
MNIILLHTNHRHVSATHTPIFEVVITDTKMYHKKINTFLKDRHLLLLPKDRTSIYHKQIQQTLQQNTIVAPSQLKTQFRIHRENIPIRPAVNNINSPAHTLAKCLRKVLQESQSGQHTPYP